MMNRRRFILLSLIVSLSSIWGCGRENPAPDSLDTSTTEPVSQASDTSSQATIVTPLAEAPPAPQGFADEAAALEALRTGGIALIEFDPQVPEGITETKDIEYGRVGDRALLLDLYSFAHTEPAPAIIFIHGGGWTGGKKEDMKFYAVTYAGKGFVTATIQYRLAGEAKWPAQINDVKNAIRWLRAHAAEYNIDPNRIAVSGNSAGGHLSLLAGYVSDPKFEGEGGYPDQSSAVQAVINFYGPTDLTTDFAISRDEPKRLFGSSYDESPELYREASPLAHLDAADPPTLILHGSIDQIVPIDQAEALARKLKELEVPYMYDRIEGWLHTMDLARDVNKRCQFYMDAFLEQHLKSASADAP